MRVVRIPKTGALLIKALIALLLATSWLHVRRRLDPLNRGGSGGDGSLNPPAPAGNQAEVRRRMWLFDSSATKQKKRPGCGLSGLITRPRGRWVLRSLLLSSVERRCGMGVVRFAVLILHPAS